MDHTSTPVFVPDPSDAAQPMPHMTPAPVSGSGFTLSPSSSSSSSSGSSYWSLSPSSSSSSFSGSPSGSLPHFSPLPPPISPLSPSSPFFPSSLSFSSSLSSSLHSSPGSPPISPPYFSPISPLDFPPLSSPLSPFGSTPHSSPGYISSDSSDLSSCSPPSVSEEEQWTLVPTDHPTRLILRRVQKEGSTAQTPSEPLQASFVKKMYHRFTWTSVPVPGPTGHSVPRLILRRTLELTSSPPPPPSPSPPPSPPHSSVSPDSQWVTKLRRIILEKRHAGSPKRPTANEAKSPEKRRKEEGKRGQQY
ncbi:hypothetical protein D5F01_LYC08305 [Larimichthys crocea]|uniref:Uncharacterized protein n=1 Tax=Larimichthys crocea TaxID=215358 RepID=A0A6G0IPM0_LARCR|nr:hypothetical protein D5F01_LYC08305 [Larimichthys crocea]